MSEDEAKELIKNSLKFSNDDISKLSTFRSMLLDYNTRYNLISKSTENLIWSRHILDSAQLIKFYKMEDGASLVDLGSGAGFPGIVLAIFNKNLKFHVKLYEKSPIKRDFLTKVKMKLNIHFEIGENVYNDTISADLIVTRAFKKLDQIIKISREKCKKPHKIIILKGKNAQAEINNVSLAHNYSYKLENSITDVDSKIIVIKVR
jgi:16S rRNA (guanine527-N7)-methyltransferase|tara:strand:+ start:3203 stop:3817 length:615 start_codon:yes stop_codon:yes gene_type:complete